MSHIVTTNKVIENSQPQSVKIPCIYEIIGQYHNKMLRHSWYTFRISTHGWRHDDFFLKRREWEQSSRAFYFKVCHSSAFQTLSIRSVYINIINYGGSILANLNKTTCNEKNCTHIQIERGFTRDYFLWWKDFKQKINFSWFSKLEHYSIYLYF